MCDRLEILRLLCHCSIRRRNLHWGHRTLRFHCVCHIHRNRMVVRQLQWLIFREHQLWCLRPQDWSKTPQPLRHHSPGHTYRAEKSSVTHVTGPEEEGIFVRVAVHPGNIGFGAYVGIRRYPDLLSGNFGWWASIKEKFYPRLVSDNNVYMVSSKHQKLMKKEPNLWCTFLHQFLEFIKRLHLSPFW